MKKPYNHTRATLALAKASFRSIIRSPSAVIFTLAFPLIFILVFGFMGNDGVKINVALLPGSNLDNPVVSGLKNAAVVQLSTTNGEKEINDALEKGDLVAAISVEKNPAGFPAYTANVKYTAASSDRVNILKSILENLLFKLNAKDSEPTVADLNERTVVGRVYRTIDFILPGQLGFALLSTGVFGTAFVFFSLRQTLVIKRFFATPVRRSSIVLGEAIARIGFSLLGALFIIIIGRFFFGFTLINGFVTVLNMLLLATLGVIVFMGFGFVVSGIAKSESTIPPISNIITLPQFLLSGTFFSIDAFPEWLQPISRALPLTYLNDALRKVAFEGAGLWDVKLQIFIMLIWGILVYSVAVKVFKWE
jgi:ABC-2 type transport system permease protein